MTNRFTIIASCPQRGQSRFQHRELLSQRVRSEPLQLLHNVVWGIRWWRLDKQMHMIGHDFHALNGCANPLGSLVQQGLQTSSDWTNQNGTAILRTPDQMKADIENRSPACSPTILHQCQYIPDRFLLQTQTRFHPTTKDGGLSRAETRK